MIYDPLVHRRRSIRISRYDYATPGSYFITIIVEKRRCLFGEITDGAMRLNGSGRIASEEWVRTAEIRPDVTLDAFVVMPNHIHGIITIRGAVELTPGDVFNPRRSAVECFGIPISNSIPTIVRSFKAAATKRINLLRGAQDQPVWQRGYYEHVIRNEDALRKFRLYVEHNPRMWSYDRANPTAKRRAQTDDIPADK